MKNFENKFLTEKYPDLPGSEPVERAVQKEIREGEKGPTTKEERVEAYLDRLEAIFQNPMGFRKNEGDRGGFDLLKRKILEKYTTKYEEIPENYWKYQEEEARQRGEGGDWDNASEEQKEIVKKKHAETVLIDQRASLEQWLDYFAMPDSDYIPRELKYWIFRNVLQLQELVKKKEGDKEFIEFPKRSKGTVKPFPDINYEALGYMVNAVDEKLKGQNIEFEHDIQPDEREAFLKFLQKQDFAKLYAWANELHQPIPEHLLPVTEGKWVKYDQGSDPNALVKTIRGKGTGWCTAGLSTAKKQLEGGDFYVYYTLDDNSEPTIPRLAIRMEGHNKIAEDPRGIAYKQNLDSYATPILEKKLEELGSIGESYKNKAANMKKLTIIENAVSNGDFSDNNKTVKEEFGSMSKALSFLYELDASIEGFGYQKDPRIQELRDQRNKDEDMLIIFECAKEQIARTPEEINENTRAYIGEWNPKIYRIIKQFPNIKHLYESFPEKKIFMQTLETDSNINSPEKAEEAIKSKNIYLGDWGKNTLYKTEFNHEGKTYKLVRFTVEQLGFPKGATTDEIIGMENDVDENGNQAPFTSGAMTKFGLGFCPAEVGPHLRLKYPGKEDFLIAMKQIAGNRGLFGVFGLNWNGGQLELDVSDARPGSWWSSGNMFVFSCPPSSLNKLGTTEERGKPV